MIPSKYVPKQLEFFVFSMQQRFLSRLRCSFWHGPLQFDSFAFCRWMLGEFENSTNAFHLERIQCCMVSSPYMSLDMTIELKTRNFHAILVCALSQKSFNWAHVLIAFAKRFWISAVLLAVSVNIVPKYVACRCRGTKEPSLNLIDDVFLLVVRFTQVHIIVGRFNFDFFQEFV